MSKIINIQITIDTISIFENVGSLSQDPNNPTGIGHNYGFMVANDNAVSGQGTADLTFSAVVGDTVRFFGASASNNFEDSVLVYNMPRFSGDQVLSDLVNRTFEKSGVAPSDDPNSVLPAKITDQEFWFLQGDVIRKGTENYKVQFALYTRNDSGSPELKGYCQWDPTIQVAG